MKIFKLFLFLVAGFYCVAPILLSQTITQEEFLNHLKQAHPLFEKEKLSAEIEKEEQGSFLGDQDWNIFGSLSLRHEKPAINFAGPDRQETVSAQGGIEKVFWNTGGRLSASYTHSYVNLKINPLYGFPNNLFQNRLAVSYLHPILRNRNGFLDKLQYNLKQFDIDFSEVVAVEKLEGFLTGSADKYLEWVFLDEQKKIAIERQHLAEEELERTQKMRASNLIDAVDVIRAQNAASFARQNVVLIESQWNALQAELAELSQNKELYNLMPTYELYQTKDTGSLEDVKTQLKEESRLIQPLKIRIQQLELVRKGFEETTRPDLSAFAEVYLSEIDDVYIKSYGIDKPDARIGVQFSVPLEKRTAKHKIDKTNLQIDQLKLEINDITLNLTSALTNLYVQINELKQVLQLNHEQIESTAKKTGEELKLYQQGRGQLTFVIQSRDEEEGAKLIYAQNALTYHKLVLQLRSLMDEVYE
jgi:hypothetical protein